MIRTKKGDDLRRMRDACRIAAQVLQHMKNLVRPGVTTYDLDQEARKLMLALGAKSACYGYRIGSRTPSYPAHTCISVNEEVIHGIASMKRVLLDGDVVSLDVVVSYDGMIGDNAATVPVGAVDPVKQKLLEVTQDALTKAVFAARQGARVGDISWTIQHTAESAGFSVVREFVGHGVGYSMHEDPQVPCFGRRGTGDRLRAGMTLAIEPMVNAGAPGVEVLADGWTAVTKDRRPSAHFEHTVLITDAGPEILTLAS
jgi:methionyl aminopeptidase